MNVGKSSSGTAKPTVGQRLKAVGANAAVNGLTGGTTNLTAYSAQTALDPTKDWDLGEALVYAGTGATGNILGGSASPAAGSVAKYLGFKPTVLGRRVWKLVLLVV